MILGWHPWAVIRVVSFVTIAVVLSPPLLGRLWALRIDRDDARVPSLATLWPAFDWQERETFDMYGIKFEGHPDLRRIFLYEEFVGYPLRKDYPKEQRQPLVRRDDLPINPIKSLAAGHGGHR